MFLLWLDHLFVSSFIADRICRGTSRLIFVSTAVEIDWHMIVSETYRFFCFPGFLFIQKTRDSSLHRDHSFFRVKTRPMTAAAKMIGAVLTNSHSNVWNATLRTAVSGS